MFSLNNSLKFWFCPVPTDMRKSFDGLCGMVQRHFDTPANNGDVFIFMNKRQDKIKLLHWEPGGFTLYYKRLESGTFQLPQTDDGVLQINWWQLCMMVEGISASKIRYRKRYNPQLKVDKSLV